MAEQQEDIFNEETKSFAYADYYTVIPMIQRYYYNMLELFRNYYELRINGRENRKLRNKIQSYIVILYDLLKNYNSVKKSKEVIYFNEHYYKINDVLSEVIQKGAMYGSILGFSGMVACKDAIVRAHFELGLSNIEITKENPNLAVRG